MSGLGYWQQIGAYLAVHHSIIKARSLFEEVQKGFDVLDKTVPPGQYYRYNDHWRFSTQRLCFLAALIVFLEKGFLIDQVAAAQMLGCKLKPLNSGREIIKIDWIIVVHEKQNLHLDLEDYLLGLLNLASELVSFV